MTEKEFDKLIRSKIAEAQFDFNPENWQRMEAILDNDRGSYLPYWRQSIGMGAAALLIGLALILFRPNQISEADPVAEQPVLNQTEQPAIHSVGSGSPSPVKKIKEDKNASSAVTSPNPSSVAAQQPDLKTPLTSTSESAANASKAADLLKLTTAERALAPLIDYLVLSWQPFGTDLRLPSALREMGSLPTHRFEPEALSKFQGDHELLVEAAPSINRSFDAQPGFGGSLGLVYRYRFAKAWNFQAGLNYFRNGNLGIKTASDSVFFGLGRTEIHTEKQYKQLRGFGIPLAVEYEFLPGHQLSVGGYLQVVQSAMVQTDSTYHQFKQDPRHYRYDKLERRPEINNFNYGLNMAYAYQISPQFSLGLAVNYGLADLTHDDHLGFAGHHQLLTGQVRLRYRLF